MPVYQPGIPTGIVNLDIDYLNIKGNFQQANIVYGTDHYPFDNATPNQGFHNLVTTPPIVNNPPDSLPPATAANPKFYAFQQYPALGVLQYSRGPSNSIPTALTKRHSPSTPISLTAGSTTPVLDFTGFTFAMVRLNAMNDELSANKRTLDQFVAWSQGTFSPFTLNQGLVASNSGNILQVKNNNASATFGNVYWTLEIIRIQ